MRWSSEALRQTFQLTALPSEWWLYNSIALLLGLAYLGAALWLFARIEYRVRYLGNLEIA
jgi:hypothetical protein